MIRRLLRGSTLYIVFGLLVLWLYWHASKVGPARSFEGTESARIVQPEVWWPKELDASILRERVLHEPRLAFALSVLSLFLAGMLIGGLALTWWGFATGRIRGLWRFTARRLPPWSFGELGRIGLLILMMASLLPFVRIAIISLRPEWDLDLHLWMTVSMLCLDCFIILAILTFAAEKSGGRSVWNALGFTPRRMVRSIELGFVGYVAVFPWLCALLALIIQLARLFNLQPPAEPIHALLFEERRTLVLSLTFVLACLVGPIAEEFLFRGVLYAALRRRTSRLAAMLVSGGLFALIHTNVMGFLPIMALGCLLAYAYERSGSLVSPLAIHVLHNTFLIVVAMVFRALTSLG